MELGLALGCLLRLLPLLLVSATNADISAASLGACRAAEWLTRQRLADAGWGGATPNAILALQAASNGTWCCSGAGLDAQLSAKQMELEIVLRLWRHHESPMTPAHLAAYTLALNSICHDPQRFHGHDLIGSLLHHEPSVERDFAMTSLAVCSSGKHVHKRTLRHLLDIAERLSDPGNSSEVFPTETLSMVLLALNCIARDHRNRKLDGYVRKPTHALGRTQAPDGSFGGNIRSTALATQALKSLEDDTSQFWQREAAESFLLAHQSADGSFGDVTLTTEVILSLTARGLALVRDVTCNVTSAHSATPTVNSLDTLTTSHEVDDVTVSYTLWVGTNVTEKHSLTVTAPRNSSFYYVMQVAGERDPHFVFAATEWPNGHYVHTLAGYKEEPSLYYYWLLYVLPSLPDTSRLPGNQLVSPVGVDGLIVEDGGHYLFWYKKL